MERECTWVPLYRVLLTGALSAEYQIEPRDSWLLAAAERNFPMFVPGREDSTRSVVHKSYAQVRENGLICLSKSYRPEYADGEQRRDYVANYLIADRRLGDVP